MPRIRTAILLAATFCGLVAVLLLAGCASPTGRTRYIEQIEPEGLTNLTAYGGTTNLELRYRFHGHYAYAYANWPPPTGVIRDFEYCYTSLEFDKQPRATRKSNIKNNALLTLREPKDWRLLVSEVFKGLTPKIAGHGVLILVQGQEIALFRDHFGSPHVTKLTEKPPDIIVDRAFSETDFSRQAINLMEERVTQIEAGQTKYLFITDDNPAFVLIDLQQHLIIFISYPVDPENQPLSQAGWFTVRTMNTLIIRGFLISALKNPVTMVSRGLWHIGSSGAALLNSAPPGAGSPPPPLYKGPGMDMAKWEEHLDQLVPGRRFPGKVDFLIDGEQFFPALIKSIENATRSVDVLVYIFGSDHYSVTIANVLKERSAVARVRVLMDAMGTLFGGSRAPKSTTPPGFKHPGDIVSYLTTGSRVAVRTAANPWLTNDHRKCIIIDGKVAYVGGMNIGWNYRYEWHDLMVRLSGPIVGRLEKEFNEAWVHAGWLGDFAYAWVNLFGHARPKENKIPDAIEIRPLRTATAHTEIYRAEMEAIRYAKGYIYIENPYFTDNSVLRELVRARQRGVDVRVILPEKADNGAMQTGNLIMANELVGHGIRVFAYPGMTHVKAAIFDGWACLGSANMEKMSLRVSQELDVAFSDPASVNRLKEGLFEADFKHAREITEQAPVNWFDFFVKVFADQI